MSVFDDSSLSDFDEDTGVDSSDELVPGSDDGDNLNQPDSFFDQYSTPVQSQTPNTFGSIFSQISQGIAGTIQNVIPQFTNGVLQAGANQISQLPGTYQGTTSGTPTSAQPATNTSIFSTPTGWLLIGGIGLVAFLLFKKL
jgi:hypothetical protein